MSTRAIQYLKKAKIPFEVVTYDHQEKGARFAARAVGFPLESTIKTLVVKCDPKGFVLVLMPGNVELDLKRLARELGVKRAAMADTADAERLTGYRVGGISPFGTRQGLPVAADSRILESAVVLINAGHRGVMLKMKPQDILKILKCRIAPLATA